MTEERHKCRNCGTDILVSFDKEYTHAYLCYDCFCEYHMAYKKGMDVGMGIMEREIKKCFAFNKGEAKE